MNIWLWVIGPLVVSSCIYAVLAGAYYYVAGRHGMALCFVGYVTANVGLVIDALQVNLLPK